MPNRAFPLPLIVDNTTTHIMSFGTRLKELRTKKGLSKSDLGRAVDVHYTQLGRYERDEASPSADVLKRLANVLEVSTDFLMSGNSSDLAQESIQDKTLINLFQRVQRLEPEERKVVTSLLEAFLFRQETKKQLA